MNLSHVERYFADFLSVMESGEAISLYSESENRYPVPSRIRLPDNLFIIGTVNIDETTYMFSPKVLDRANTIEFRVDAEDMERYFEGPRRVWPESLVSRGAEMAAGFLNMSRTVSGTASNDEECISVLLLFFNELQKLGAEFGYRSAHEISRLFGQLRRVDKAMADDDIIDIVLMQKLLPRLHGARRRICPVLEKMAQLCVNDANPGFEQDFLKSDMAGLAKYGIKYPMSLEKICRMHSNAVEHGFASYAEA
jgi:5-methylcytosine-specific restriction protein B